MTLAKVHAARAALLRESAFFGSLVMHLACREDPSATLTMGVTPHGSLVYHPQFVEAVPLVDLVGIVAHEALHVGLGHHLDILSLRGDDVPTYNLAADVVVNSWLLAAGFRLPEGAYRARDLPIPELAHLQDEQVHLHYTAAELYRLLRSAQPTIRSGFNQDAQPSAQPHDQADQAARTQPGGGSSRRASSGGTPEDASQGGTPTPQMPGQRPMDSPSDTGSHSAPGCAPASDGSSGNACRDLPWVCTDEAADRTLGRWAGSQDLLPTEPGQPHPSREEVHRLRDEVERSLLAAAAAESLAQGRGDLPAWLLKRLGLAPRDLRVPWQRALADALRTATERSLRRPSRRHLWRSAVLPGRAPSKVRVVICVDTSASMPDEVLADLGRELHRLAATGEVEFLATIWADTVVQRTERGLPAQWDVRYGGGGTDFRPALDLARTFAPDVVLYLTDGDGANYPSPPAGLHVVWVLTEPYPQPWGKNLFIRRRPR